VKFEEISKQLTALLVEYSIEIQKLGNTEIPLVVVQLADIREISRRIQKGGDFKFNSLEGISVSQRKTELIVSYFFNTLTNPATVVIRGNVSLKNVGESGSIDSISDIWPSAQLHEQEASDLFGLRFGGTVYNRMLTVDQRGSSDTVRYPMRRELDA